MKSKHTPGPWEILPEEPDKDYIRVRGTVLGGKYKIANVPFVRNAVWVFDVQEARENAKLIAAAPEMLECLKDIMSSGIVKHDPRIDYDEFQIDRDTQEQARRLLERLK